MKKKKTLSALCSLLLALLLTPIAAAAQPTDQAADDFKPVLRFAVISDLHISKDRSHHVFSSTFPKTMKTLYEISSANPTIKRWTPSSSAAILSTSAQNNATIC